MKPCQHQGAPLLLSANYNNYMSGYLDLLYCTSTIWNASLCGSSESAEL